MVKGISRQVIVVQSPEPKLFEQAIFILKEGQPGQEGVTDEILLREATSLISQGKAGKSMFHRWHGPAWACGGAMLTGLAWLISNYL